MEGRQLHQRVTAPQGAPFYCMERSRRLGCCLRPRSAGCLLPGMRPRQASKLARLHLPGSYNETFAAQRLPQRQPRSAGFRGRNHPAQVLVVTMHIAACLFSLLSKGLHGYLGSPGHAFGVTCGARWAGPHVVPGVVRQQRSRLCASGQAARPQMPQAVLQQVNNRPEERLQFPKLTAAEQQALLEGREVRKEEREGRKGSILFVTEVLAPPAAVIDKLRAFDSYPEMIPSVRWAQVQACVRTGACTYSTQAEYRISRFGLNVAVVHSVDRAARTVGFKLDESCARLVLQEASGTWLVETAPGGNANRSRVFFQMTLKATRWLPVWLVNYAAERAMWRATFWLKPYMEDMQGSS